MKTTVGYPDDDDEENNQMPKMNFGIANAADIEAATGVKKYKGPLPPNNAYQGILKRVVVGKIGSGDDKGKNKLNILVEINDPDFPEFNGCPAWGNLNLTEQGVPYVNQFLESLTDGSESAKEKIKRAFWKTGPVVDAAKEHIKKIGTLNINSPEGTLTVIVQTKRREWNGETTINIQQYMLTDDEDSDGDDDIEEEGIGEVDVDTEDAEGSEDGDEDEDADPYAEDEEE